MRMTHYKVCECGTSFTAHREDAMFCSAKCRMAHSRKNAQSKEQANELTLTFEQAMAIGEMGRIDGEATKKLMALMGERITSNNMDEILEIMKRYAMAYHRDRFK